jgi:hypothetical protein
LHLVGSADRQIDFTAWRLLGLLHEDADDDDAPRTGSSSGNLIGAPAPLIPNR